MATDNISPEINNFLNKILEGKIEDYTIHNEGSGEKGGNFMGDLLFIDLKNKNNNEDIHLVIKQAFPMMATNPVYKYIYSNEIHFYQNIWKTFDNFQKSHKVGFDKIAKYFGGDLTEGQEKLALDNLKYYGYVLHDKNNPLTNRHLQMIMKSYGVFHAISFAYRELHPEEYAELIEPCKKVSFNMMSFLFQYEFEDLVKILENEIDDKIFKIMKTYVTESGKMFTDAINYVGDTPLMVQGDCWSNNMMFKSDERGNIEDMKFLDFQYVGSGSPVYDLSYSIYSGASKDLLDNLDFYLKIYHNSFAKTLKKFGCDAQKSYPFEKLKAEWKQYCKFGFMMSLTIWRMKYVDKNFIPNVKDLGDIDIEETMEKEPENMMMKIADDKVDVHKRRIIELMTHMYENGFL